MLAIFETITAKGVGALIIVMLPVILMGTLWVIEYFFPSGE